MLVLLCALEILWFVMGSIGLGLIVFVHVLEILLMTLSQLNKYSSLNANIYMDSCILADVLFIHNIIHVFTLIMSHINGPQIQREEIKCLKLCALAFTCIMLKIIHLRRHLLLKVTAKYQMFFRVN